MARLKIKYFLLTIALILVPLFVSAWNTAIIGGGVPSGGCTGEYCIGVTTTCEDLTSGPDIAKDYDYTFANKWTATEGGTVTYVHLRTGNTAPSNITLPVAFVYNGDTLIGSADASSVSAADTNYKIAIIVEGGQSLTFATNDVLTYGYSRDGGANYTDFDYTSPGSPDGVMWQDTLYHSDTAPSAWDQVDSLTFSFQLEYCK